MTDYTFVWANHQPHWNIQANFMGPEKFRHIVWNQIGNVISVSRKNQISTYHSFESLENDTERGKAFLDINTVKQFLREVDAACSDHKQLFNRLKNTDYSLVSNQELFDLFKQVLTSYAKTISYFRATQAQGTSHIVQELHNHFSEEEALLLLNPIELDEAGHEKMDWQKILQEEISENRLLSHVEKYPWLAAAHYTLPEVLETVRTKFEIDKKKSHEKNIIQEKEELRQKQEKILARKPHLTEKVSLVQQLSLSDRKSVV